MESNWKMGLMVERGEDMVERLVDVKMGEGREGEEGRVRKEKM